MTCNLFFSSQNLRTVFCLILRRDKIKLIEILSYFNVFDFDVNKMHPYETSNISICIKF